MAERSRRNTLTTVSSSALNSRTSSSLSSKASSAPFKEQRSMVSSSNAARYSMSTAGGGGRSTGASRSSGASRASMGTKRPSMGRPSTGRPSMGHPSMTAGERKSSTGVRRSTTYGNSSSGRSDSRPLMDKAFLNASLHKLADYLSSHGYDQPINAKTLSRPSGRDFNNIMGFLFRQIDPNYKPSGRFEDDVIPFLKMLRYPFALSRSSLAAVGAPQTWPKVMGAISWVVETLLFDEAVAVAEEEQQLRRQQAAREDAGQGQEDEDDDLNEEVANLKEFIDYLGEGYIYFLEGDDEAFSELLKDYVNAREAESARAEEITKEREDAIERVTQRIQELQKEGESLPQLKEGLSMAQSDRDKYVSLEEQLKAYQEKLQEKIDKRKEEERKLKEALVTVQESHVALREQISRQEFSADDVERHLAERRRVKDAMKNATEAKTKTRKDGWTAQEEMLRHKEMLKEALMNYETKAKALLLIPNGSQPAKNGGDINFEVSLDEDKLHDEEGILSNDVRGLIRPGLNQLKVAIMRRTQGLREGLSNLLVEEDKVEEEITDVENELEVIKKQVKLKEMTYAKEKQALDQKVVAMKRGLEEEERRLESLEAAEDLDRLTAGEYETIDILRVEIEALKERQETELKQGENILHSALETALDYKEREEKCLAGLKERYRQHLAAAEHGETPFDVVLVQDGFVEGLGEDGDSWKEASDPTLDKRED